MPKHKQFAIAVVLLAIAFTQAFAQQTIDWSRLRPDTSAAHGMRRASGVPTFYFDHTGQAGYKSTLEFRDDNVVKGEFGIDSANDGTRRFYFTTGYTWQPPLNAGASATDVLTWGAGGNTTWATPAGTGGWTDDGAVVRLTTAADTVPIGRANMNSTGATLLVTKSATGAMGGEIWIMNDGVSALNSNARLAFGPASVGSTPNWGIETPMINTAGWRADMVFKAYDSTGYNQKARLVNVSSTQYALLIGTGAVANLCCGDSFAIQGPYDSHQNVSQVFYRATGTTMGAAMGLVGTTAGDWVSNSAQHDFFIRGQSTVHLSSGAAGYRGYKLTATTHDWYVSDAAKLALDATKLSSTLPIYAPQGSNSAPGYAFNGTNGNTVGMWMDESGPSTTHRLLWNAGEATATAANYRMSLTRADNAPEPTALRLINNQTSSNPALAYNELHSIDKTGTPVVVGLYVNTSFLDITSGSAYRIGGTQVVGARGAAVADASGGATVDTEARTAINTLLARLRTHGLIAP